MTYNVLVKRLRDAFPKTREEKLRIVAKLTCEGVRNIQQVRRESGIAPRQMEKMKHILRAYQAEQEDLAIAAEMGGPPNAEAPSAEPGPGSILQPPALTVKTADDGATILSGPLFLSRIDAMLEAALEDQNERKVKILHDIRKEIADFATEMPVTHLDIERTVGLEGLAGMDQVLCETLALFFEDIDHYPLCMAFLSDVFKLPHDFWARFRGAANTSDIYRTFVEKAHPDKPDHSRDASGSSTRLVENGSQGA
jgi:hypothetical protein